MSITIGVKQTKGWCRHHIATCDEQCEESALHSFTLAMCAEAYRVVQSLPLLSVVSHAGHLNHTCSNRDHALARREQCLIVV